METAPVGEPVVAVDAVARLHRRFEVFGQQLPVTLWDGTQLGPTDASYRLKLQTPWALRAMVSPPSSAAVGEAYLRDDIDVEGSMVAALTGLRLAMSALPRHERARMLTTVTRLPAPPKGVRPPGVRLRGRRHLRARDQQAVRHHYDLDADFFATFLDEAKVYSCGYFAESDRHAPATDRHVLHRAQQRKLELICRKLDLKPSERLLDVGCGWGALVVFAAKHFGVHATGITLSPPQAEAAKRAANAAGVSDRVHIEVADYRDVDDSYDAIASIGMVEHVGVQNLPRYAKQLHAALAPGGRLLNHGITTGRRNVVRDMSKDRDNFIARYVFPDGALVPTHHHVRIFQEAGFEVWDLEQLRPHYARTLMHWVANLEADASTARRIGGEQAYRVWRAYMAGSVLGFASNDLAVVQVLAAKEPATMPFGRDRMQLRLAP